MKKHILATLAVATLLVIAMLGLRHTDKLNDGIKLKEIQLQDNSIRLELLDKKYDELHKNLEQTGADKAKVEEQLKQLQIERDKLQKDLQARKEQKAKDLAAKAQKAVVASVSVPKAYAATNDCFGTTGAKNFIYSKESTCTLHSVNGGGCKGLGQDCNGALPKACPNWRTDFACQDAFWESYMKRRYGSWEKAKAHWLARVPINGKNVGNWW